MFCIKRQRVVALLLLAVLVAASFISGCGQKTVQENQTANDDEQLMTIRVAKQFGLVYAPLMVAEKIDFFSSTG